MLMTNGCILGTDLFVLMMSMCGLGTDLCIAGELISFSTALL